MGVFEKLNCPISITTLLVVCMHVNHTNSSEISAYSFVYIGEFPFVYLLCRSKWFSVNLKRLLKFPGLLTCILETKNIYFKLSYARLLCFKKHSHLFN